MKEKILVSSCLLGNKDRYDGSHKLNERVVELGSRYEFIPICPERFGGLVSPRNPSEQKGDRVFDNVGNDITEQFMKGAMKCLEIAKNHNCKIAILKSKSPSCGVGKVYDGTFTGTLVDGNGVTAKLLRENGVEVFSENALDKLYN